MENVVRVSKHLVPVERIALIEPFVASSGEPLNTKREFKTRIVLRDRISVLSEETPEQLAKAHGFRWIEADKVGTNPNMIFRVEMFTATESFKPSKPFRSRLAWNDEEGNTQSKLMVTEPEDLLAIVVRGGSENGEANQVRAPVRRRPRRKQRQPTREPA